MSTAIALSATWEAYDQRKATIHQDPNIFCPDELWEFNYLLDNLLIAEPHLDVISVMLAIRQGMRETMAPRSRQHFIQLVVDNIRERENQWAKIVENAGRDVA